MPDQVWCRFELAPDIDCGSPAIGLITGTWKHAKHPLSDVQVSSRVGPKAVCWNHYSHGLMHLFDIHWEPLPETPLTLQADEERRLAMEEFLDFLDGGVE